MNKSEINQQITELNDELKARDVKGELCLYGGAVMCLVYDARPSTKDVDAVFKPTAEIRDAIKKILADVKQAIPRDPENWTIPFMDFADDFQAQRDARLLSEPLLVRARSRRAFFAPTIF